MAKNIANTNPLSSLMAAHCMATVTEKFKWSDFETLKYFCDFSFLNPVLFS